MTLAQHHFYRQRPKLGFECWHVLIALYDNQQFHGQVELNL